MCDTVRKLAEARRSEILNDCELRKVALVVAKHHLKLVTPTDDIRTVTSRRKKNAELRTREHLMPGEVAALMEAAKAENGGARAVSFASKNLDPALRSLNFRLMGSRSSALSPTMG